MDKEQEWSGRLACHRCDRMPLRKGQVEVGSSRISLLDSRERLDEVTERKEEKERSGKRDLGLVRIIRG